MGKHYTTRFGYKPTAGVRKVPGISDGQRPSNGAQTENAPPRYSNSNRHAWRNNLSAGVPP